MVRRLLSLTMLVISGNVSFATEIAHGVSAGEVTDRSAVIWSRFGAEARMHVRYVPVVGTGEVLEVSTSNSADNDFTAQVKLPDLQPATLYRYEVSFDARGERSGTVAGSFRTAPAADASADVSIVFSGDLAGQRYCRREGIGYRIFEPMRELRADFFVANGDMIYADNDCPENGMEPGWKNVAADFPGIGARGVDWRNPASLAEVFNAHWRYNRKDAAFQAFLASTPVYVQWDDHEVINDFGGSWEKYPPQAQREGYPNVVAAGRKSFFDYHPIERHAEEPDRIYRSFRWGKHVELFILDARSYRSENTDPDKAGKTMLGETQLAWITGALRDSDATWKIVSSDVPLSVPTGSRAEEFGRDAFAGGTSQTGFETELMTLVRALDTADVSNVVFVATDVHSAAHLRYDRDYDGDGDRLLFHEFIAGPLSAIKGPAPVTLDPTLGPVMLYGEGGFFNFATIRVEAAAGARLHADVRDEFGAVRPGSELMLSAEK